MGKRIVFFMGSMERGGAERVVSILSRYYCELGWSVDICMLLHNINKYPLDQRVSVIDMSNETCKNVSLRNAKMLIDIRRYIKEHTPDVVVPFLAKTSALVWLAMLGKSREKFRIVASERIDPYVANYSKFLRIAVNRSFKKADAVVFQTKRAKGYYSSSIQSKSRIIGNPVTMKYERSEKPDSVIITGGRLEYQKNQKMLINAFARIANKYPNYSLHIYGEGSLQVELEKQIIELCLEKRVFLKGNSLKYQENLAKAEVFVLSSNYEGLSNALLEAMMLGMPCISTNCAGSDEIIRDGENGLLIPVGNAEKLSDALDRLLGDKELQDKLGENARETASTYETYNVIGNWREVLEG